VQKQDRAFPRNQITELSSLRFVWLSAACHIRAMAPIPKGSIKAYERANPNGKPSKAAFNLLSIATASFGR
jgi:hypothetical protein